MSDQVDTALEVDVYGGVLTCKLNRPDSMNSLRERDLRDLAALWAGLPDRDDVNVVILTGSGRAFCAGGDVEGMASGDLDVAAASMDGYGSACFKNLAAVPQPVIAAVNGDAVGAGMLLVAIADFAIAADSARLGDPHVRLGLVAPGAGLLVPSIGLRHTKELLLGGRLIDAAHAAEIGLVNRVVPTDSVMTEARSLAEEIASSPAEAVRWTKRCLNRLLDHSWDLTWETELAMEALASTTPSHKAVAAAFVAKTSR